MKGGRGVRGAGTTTGLPNFVNVINSFYEEEHTERSASLYKRMAFRERFQHLNTLILDGA